MYNDKKWNQKNMKECDKRKSHIKSKLHRLICLLIMLDTLLKRPTLHFNTLHPTTLHYISPHFTQLHFTTLHPTTRHFISPHFTQLHFTTLVDTSLIPI